MAVRVHVEPARRHLMERSTLPSVSHAFARAVWRTVTVVLLFAVSIFTVASYRLIKNHDDEHLLAQTLLSASMIRSGDLAEFRNLAAGLQVHSPEFVAIAVVLETGQLDAVFPETLQHRKTAQTVLTETPGSTIKAISPKTTRAARMVAVPMPVRESCITTNRVFAIFETASHATTLLNLLLFSGCLTGAMAVAAFLSLRTWFDRHVAGPLKTFSSIPVPRDDGAPGPAAIPLGPWKETARVAEILKEFSNAMIQTDARARKIEEDTVRQIRDREAGFDRQLRRFRDQAATDPLTKLRNRTFLDETLPELFQSQGRQGKPLAAIMLDLDNFKSYNDSHGHQAGDALLRFVGALLRGSIRPTDCAVRYGGDEFLIVLPETGARQAAAIADRIVKLFGQYSSCLEQNEKLSMSAGVAACPEEPCELADDLLAKADQALYAAKAAGKNTVVLSRPAAGDRSPPPACVEPAEGFQAVEASP